MKQNKYAKRIIEILIKEKRKYAPEAHGYEITKAPSLEKFYKKYKEVEELIEWMK